jgi:hypothetical protein
MEFNRFRQFQFASTTVVRVQKTSPFDQSRIAQKFLYAASDLTTDFVTYEVEKKTLSLVSFLILGSIPL